MEKSSVFIVTSVIGSFRFHVIYEQLSAFVEQFLTEGPGAKDIDMETGITLIEHYIDQFKLFEQQRLEFGKPLIHTFTTEPNICHSIAVRSLSYCQ